MNLWKQQKDWKNLSFVPKLYLKNHQLRFIVLYRCWINTLRYELKFRPLYWETNVFYRHLSWKVNLSSYNDSFLNCFGNETWNVSLDASLYENKLVKSILPLCFLNHKNHISILHRGVTEMIINLMIKIIRIILIFHIWI